MSNDDAAGLKCPRCERVIGMLANEGNAVLLSEACAVFYRARLTCRWCGFHFYFTPTRDARERAEPRSLPRE